MPDPPDGLPPLPEPGGDRVEVDMDAQLQRAQQRTDKRRKKHPNPINVRARDRETQRAKAEADRQLAHKRREAQAALATPTGLKAPPVDNKEGTEPGGSKPVATLPQPELPVETRPDDGVPYKRETAPSMTRDRYRPFPNRLPSVKEARERLRKIGRK